MKLTALFAALLFNAHLFAQAPLASEVYVQNKSPETKTKTGTRKEILSGSGAILTKQTITLIKIEKGKTLHYKPAPNGDELFFIIKNGPVTVGLNQQHNQLDRGSVVLVLPGDTVSMENTGNTDAQVYEMRYRSIAQPDADSRSKAGTSFMMNWNDMVFKPHNKGGVRQLFDRQTAMFNRFDIHVTQLNQGWKSHDPHTHKNEEIILMLDGHAEMQIGSGHQKANPGDVVWLGSNVLHNLSNIGNTPCLYFAIQWN